jgi:hypothetical protein
MAKFNCFIQTMSKLVIGIFFVLFGLGAVISGFTVLPIFGFLLAAALFYIGWYFIHAHLNRQCEIEG